MTIGELQGTVDKITEAARRLEAGTKGTSKHTPGEWTVLKEDDGDIWIYGNGNNRGGAMCRMLPPGSKYISGETGEVKDFLNENMCNARLIAAAPDMLDTLWTVLCQVELPLDVENMVSAAIIKATGGTL